MKSIINEITSQTTSKAFRTFHVQFADQVDIAYTHDVEVYDRTAVPIAKVTFAVATEILQYRLDMKREYAKLIAQAANNAASDTKSNLMDKKQMPIKDTPNTTNLTATTTTPTPITNSSSSTHEDNKENGPNSHANTNINQSSSLKTKSKLENFSSSNNPNTTTTTYTNNNKSTAKESNLSAVAVSVAVTVPMSPINNINKSMSPLKSYDMSMPVSVSVVSVGVTGSDGPTNHHLTAYQPILA